MVRRPPLDRYRRALVLTAALVLLSACGSDDDPAASRDDERTTTSPSTEAASSSTADVTSSTTIGATAPSTRPGHDGGQGGGGGQGKVHVEHGIQYGTGEVAGGEMAPLLMDVYRPPGESGGPLPIVILMHGGGFMGGTRTDPNIRDIARGLAQRGIVSASIDYRLTPQGPVPSERVAPIVAALGDGELPAGMAIADDDTLTAGMAIAVDDTLTATDYLADHADELGIDMARLGLIGSSAGAITADHVAYTLDDHGVPGPTVRFVGDLWGGIFVAPPPELGPEGTPGAVQLEAGEAALFAVHGEADDKLPITLDDQLTAQAEDEGVTVEYHRIPGGGHGYQKSHFFTERVDGDQTPFDRLLAFAEAQLG